MDWVEVADPQSRELTVRRMRRNQQTAKQRTHLRSRWVEIPGKHLQYCAYRLRGERIKVEGGDGNSLASVFLFDERLTE